MISLSGRRLALPTSAAPRCKRRDQSILFSPAWIDLESKESPPVLEQKNLEISHLQISSLKILPFWQKKRGPTENILHFFSRFFRFWGFFPLQAVALQRPVVVQAFPKKSCQKTDGRFSVRPGMCHNRCVKVEISDWNEGRERWTAMKRRPALRARRFGARNDTSAFGHSAAKRPWRARIPNPGMNPIFAKGTKNPGPPHCRQFDSFWLNLT